MSSLPNNTFASPGNPFYALVGSGGGGGSASSLQSPASVIPDAALGNATLTLAGEALGTSVLSIQGQNSVLSLQAINLFASSAAIRTMEINASTDGTDVPLAVFDYTNDNIALGKPLFGGSITLNSTTTVAEPFSVTSGANTSFTTNPTTNETTVGNPLTAGAVYLNNTTTVTSSGTRPAPSGITLTPTSATVSNIGQAVAAGGSLVLGSSIASPDTLTVADAAGSGTVAVGGNAGSSIVMTGGAGASQTSIITTSATGVGSLLLGASAANDRTIFINDTAGAANTAVVDITGGTATGVALRLRGYGTGTAATISTNAGAGGVLNIQNNATDIPPNMTLNDASTTINGLVLVPNDLSFVGSGSITAFQTFQTTGVTCGDNTTAGIPNPGGLVVGLYMVLARGTIGGVSSVACSVSTISYWDGSSWKWGGGGAAPALVTAPPSYIGIQGGGATLVLGNGGGLGTVTMDFTYLKLGGNLGI
jgi:hypothetical protein